MPDIEEELNELDTTNNFDISRTRYRDLESLNATKPEAVVSKLAAKLISDKNKELNKYAKNLIRFNDEINFVKTERKRKVHVKNINNVHRNVASRKIAHSLYTSEAPLASERRMRIESNYTTRSGDRRLDTSEDRESMSSHNKFRAAH